MDELEQLHAFLKMAWRAETSADSENWSEENPAWGQCAVTALIVQDEWGGELLRTEALLPDGRKISHYFNRVAGVVVDFTRGQFPEGTKYEEEILREREYVLSYPETQRRYELLRADACSAPEDLAGLHWHG